MTPSASPPTAEQVALLRSLCERAGIRYRHPRTRAQAIARIDVARARLDSRPIAQRAHTPAPAPAPSREDFFAALTRVKRAIYRLSDAEGAGDKPERIRVLRRKLADAERAVDRIVDAQEAAEHTST